MPTEGPPPGAENRTFICTVVFVDLVDYSKRPVTQQAALKERLNQAIARALAQVAESDRMTLDTGDGAALCFFGDPEDALFAAGNLRADIASEPGPAGAQIRLGINLGPVRLVRDLNGSRNIIGDGINVAQRVMGFAVPNQILVSRSYYEVVSHISHDYAGFFQYAGLHRDKHVREHELYEVQGPGVAASAVDAPAREPAVFAPEFLKRVTRILTGHLGPVARVIVQRASQQAQNPRQLISAAAESLAGTARAAFLTEASEIIASGPPTPEPSGAAPAGLPAQGPLTPAMLSAVEERLARHVGPIARLLVAQAAKEVSDAGRLAERLAGHIESTAARQSFLAAMAEISAK